MIIAAVRDRSIDKVSSSVWRSSGQSVDDGPRRAPLFPADPLKALANSDRNCRRHHSPVRGLNLRSTDVSSGF